MTTTISQEIYEKFLNQREQKGRTAIYMGVEAGRTKCVETLLEFKANPEVPDNEGTTPLYLACTKGHFACIKALVGAGAKTKFPAGKTNLVALVFKNVTAAQEKRDAVYELLANGAVIDGAELDKLVDELKADKDEMKKKIEEARTIRSTKLSQALKAVAPLPTSAGATASPMDIISQFTGFDIGFNE